MESDLSKTRLARKNNPYGDDFVVDRIDLKRKLEELVGLEEIPASQDIDNVNDQPKKSKFSGFMLELFRHTKRSKCECIVEYTGHKDFNSAWKENWLRFASEDGL